MMASAVKATTQDVTEEYTDLDSNLRNLRATEAQILTLMERATEQPKIEFELPSGVRGLEYAEAVREGGNS